MCLLDACRLALSTLWYVALNLKNSLVTRLVGLYRLMVCSNVKSESQIWTGKRVVPHMNLPLEANRTGRVYDYLS